MDLYDAVRPRVLACARMRLNHCQLMWTSPVCVRAKVRIVRDSARMRARAYARNSPRLERKKCPRSVQAKKVCRNQRRGK